LFFTGIDIVGNKLIEVNLMSPGGLYSTCQLSQTDFIDPIVRSLENKHLMKKIYNQMLTNAQIATLA
jgi:glutathione synthase